MKVKCPNKDCNKEWDYLGDSKWYATCPQCHGNVRVRELVKEAWNRTYGVDSS